MRRRCGQLHLWSFAVVLCIGAGADALAGAGKTTVKVLVTPLVVVRDVVDAPLVTLTNAFEVSARKSKDRALNPDARVGWSLRGPILGISFDVSYFVTKGLSFVCGAVDYVPCRSLYPNTPAGISPWLQEGESWGSLYFPNTRAVWASEPEAMSASARF